MIRICTKRHQETRRFTDEKIRFHPDEMDKALNHAQVRSLTEFAVKIEAEDTFSGRWYELKTIYNTKNDLVH